MLEQDQTLKKPNNQSKEYVLSVMCLFCYQSAIYRKVWFVVHCYWLAVSMQGLLLWYSFKVLQQLLYEFNV